MSGHRPFLWLLENGLRWTSVQELFEAKLEPSIQSIIFALISYSNVHQCPEKCCLFNRTPISGRAELQLPRKADAAGLLASHNPYRIGSVACIQDRSEIEERLIDWKASRTPISKRPNCFSHQYRSDPIVSQLCKVVSLV